MDAKTQIIVLTFSYLYGFILYYIIIFNNAIIKNKKRIYRSLIAILLMYNIVLIYIISLFKLNHGQFHIYFFLMIILGFWSNISFTKKLLNNVKCQRLVAKIKKKWYTKAK